MVCEEQSDSPLFLSHTWSMLAVRSRLFAAHTASLLFIKATHACTQRRHPPQPDVTLAPRYFPMTFTKPLRHFPVTFTTCAEELETVKCRASCLELSFVWCSQPPPPHPPPSHPPPGLSRCHCTVSLLEMAELARIHLDGGKRVFLADESSIEKRRG